MLLNKIAMASALALGLSSGMAFAGSDEKKDMMDKASDKAHHMSTDLKSSSRIKADWVDALDIQEEDKAEKIREIQASYWSEKEDLHKEMSEIEEEKNEKLREVLSEDQLNQLETMERGHQGGKY